MKIIMVLKRKFRDDPRVPNLQKLQESIPEMKILSEEDSKYIYLEISSSDLILLKEKADNFYLIEEEKFYTIA